MNQLRAGDVVAERFEIERRAAAGGMGAIYRARDRVSGDMVALKVLLGGMDRESDRFRREARILADLNHPGLVRYVAHGVGADGVGYLAMEWLEGQALTERIKEPMTAANGVTLARRVAEALAAAHERGIVHRDIKPANLFLPDGQIEKIKVIDFGIARFGRSPSLLTGEGIMLGTPRYMAPEQARGAREIDARADLFALGCVIYECLTARRAFPGDDVLAVLAKVVLDEAPRVRELAPKVPVALDDLVYRMMSKDPAGRPPSAAAVAIELAAIDVGTRPSRAPPALASRLTRGERRFVSVVVAASPFDVDVLETITQDSWDQSAELAQRLTKTVAAFGARFDVLADGSMVATLIGQKSPTDQAVLAARCALAIRAELRDVAMVLASGRGVLAGRLPFGEVIDTAVRMLHENMSPDARDVDAIRLDEVTAGLLDVRFVVTGDERGLSLRAEREIVEETRTLLGKPTPFVGRERELLTLEALFAECQAESVARGMLVTAAAGVGKSRLRHEFLRKVRQNYPTTEIWIARGDPMRAGSSFGMLAQAIRRAAGYRESEPLSTRQQKLRARIARHIEGADLPRIADFLGELVGVAVVKSDSVQVRAARQDPRLMGDQMRRAWEDFLLAECAGQPLLLVLEDFHWGDLPTVHTIDTALRVLHDRPFMVLALARPEVNDLFPRLWQDRGVTHLRLQYLTPRASKKLVRQALGEDLDETVVSTIAERAAGNAFYLEELIRSVAEGSHETLPATVMAMVQTRLERLDSEVRRVLRAASIFGEVFWRGGLVELLGYAGRIPELEEHLRVLIDQELISRRGEGKFSGEEELVFRHGIVRDAAYGMLTARDAELGHRLAGAWLEVAGETEALILAEHFERGALPLRAVSWYRKAAEQSLEGNDFEAAFARAARGLECGATDEMLGHLRLLQAQAQEWLGHHQGAAEAALAAMRWLRAGTRPWFVAAGELAISAGRMGDFDVLGDLAVSLNEVPAEHPPDGEYVIACARAQSQLLLAGRHEAAAVLAARSESLAAELTPNDAAVITQMNLSRALQAHFGGDPAEARRLSEAAAASFAEAGDLRHACAQQLNVGYFSGELGAYARAADEVRAALLTAERMGLSSVATAARHNLGMFVAREGDIHQGLELEAEAIEMARDQGDPRMEAGARIYRAKILHLLGDIDGAAEEAQTAVITSGTSLPARAKGLATLARSRMAQGRGPEALAAASEAHEILEQLGGVDGEEEAIRLAHAEALHVSGDLLAARAAIVAAHQRLLARAEKISDPNWRRSFLENVPENVRTAELAQEWAAKKA